MGETNDRLRRARKAAGFRSARAAALKFGWPPSTYSAHENGQIDPVPPDMAFKYAAKFRTSPLWILYGIGGDHVSIDAMLIGQPKEVWEEMEEHASAVLRHRSKRSG